MGKPSKRKALLVSVGFFALMFVFTAVFVSGFLVLAGAGAAGDAGFPETDMDKYAGSLGVAAAGLTVFLIIRKGGREGGRENGREGGRENGLEGGRKGGQENGLEGGRKGDRADDLEGGEENDWESHREDYRKDQNAVCALREVNWAKALLYAIVGVCFSRILLDSLIAYLFSGILPLPGGNMARASTVDILLSISVAPLAEESIFRYGILTSLKKAFSPKASILICSLLFAACHGFALPTFLATFGAGLFFSYLYHRTNNLWYCVTAHAASNALCTVFNHLEDNAVTLLGQQIQYTVNGYNTFNTALVIMAAVIFAGFCAAAVWRKNKEKLPQAGAPGMP